MTLKTNGRSVLVLATTKIDDFTDFNGGVFSILESRWSDLKSFCSTIIVVQIPFTVASREHAHFGQNPQSTLIQLPCAEQQILRSDLKTWRNVAQACPGALNLSSLKSPGHVLFGCAETMQDV